MTNLEDWRKNGRTVKTVPYGCFRFITGIAAADAGISDAGFHSSTAERRIEVIAGQLRSCSDGLPYKC